MSLTTHCSVCRGHVVAAACSFRVVCCTCGILPAARDIAGALQRAGPLSSKPGTHMTVKARFWPSLSVERVGGSLFGILPAARNIAGALQALVRFRRRGANLKDFKDFYLKANAIIWP